MASRYDTDQLIAQIKRTQTFPTSQRLFTDEDFIEIANQELHTTIVPLIQSVVEEYFVHGEDFTLTSDNPSITIPPEATGLRLREIYFIDGIGGNIITKANRINIEQIGDGGPFPGGWNQTNGFYIENDEVKFSPKVQSTLFVRLMFYRSPNNLVAVTDGGTIKSIDINSNVISLTTVPTSWDSGTIVDVIKATAPFNLRSEDVTIESRGGSDLTISSDVIGDLQVGDYVYLANEAPVPQYIPTEAFYLLVQATGVKCLEALEDTEGLKAAYAKFDQMVNNFEGLISPRVVGSPKRVVSDRYISSYGRHSSWRRFR